MILYINNWFATISLKKPYYRTYFVTDDTNIAKCNREGCVERVFNVLGISRRIFFFKNLCKIRKIEISLYLGKIQNLIKLYLIVDILLLLWERDLQNPSKTNVFRKIFHYFWLFYLLKYEI